METKRSKVVTVQPRVAISAAAVTAENARAEGPTHEEIARRAYELFLARGCRDGHQDDDWYQAERELRLGSQ
ncbi:MAG: DUF2934 domain-containing protein [Myxococcales bacterium]|nr:DUF2934 domain-containing protein [Myxococcales bacterium]